jgi:hypothetical protein
LATPVATLVEVAARAVSIGLGGVGVSNQLMAHPHCGGIPWGGGMPCGGAAPGIGAPICGICGAWIGLVGVSGTAVGIAEGIGAPCGGAPCGGICGSCGIGEPPCGICGSALCGGGLAMFISARVMASR